MEKRRIQKVVAGVIAVLLCGVFYVCANVQKGEEIVTDHFQDAKTGVQAGTSTYAPESSSQNGTITSQTGENSSHGSDDNQVYIDISGEVKKPGVYRFDHTPRLVEVVKKAGGLTKKADQASVNQAQMVEDGTQIIIAARELSTGDKGAKTSKSGRDNTQTDKKTGENIDTDTNDGKININTATKEELMSLNGIGESRAVDIVSYREKSGIFRKIEDIMNVSGIKEGIFNRLKDKIKV